MIQVLWLKKNVVMLGLQYRKPLFYSGFYIAWGKRDLNSGSFVSNKKGMNEQLTKLHRIP